MLQLFIFPGSQHLHLMPSSPLSKFAQTGLGCPYWFLSSMFDEAQHKAENQSGQRETSIQRRLQTDMPVLPIGLILAAAI